MSESNSPMEVIVENVITYVVIQETNQTIIVETPNVRVIEVGIQGPQGPPGVSGNTSFVFDQSSPSATWTIPHNLNRFPSVTIVDSSERECEGDLVYTNANSLIVTFSAAFSGKAYLN